ncbi:GumC family protein [Rivihabitans pingtungensis]|uniref:GumC family protein n=1 Tax=Rivihabitans pingtungensis TaxID=1054498 RepID=UPI0023525FC5|nr:GNVR domain-containing protein [Rivihabitans pingtungensis]MCK6437841.1 Wzz/FepE/Etk N-terminal domain-containing protein [Rivihabitans pingtungensis]
MSSQESMPLDEESVAQMPQEPALVEPKFHPLDVILSLLRYKRWLVICPLIAAVIAFAFVSTQLPRYSAMARLLPPKTKPNTATMLSQTGSLAGAGVSGVLEGQKPVVDMYLAILQSRAAAEFMDSNFDLRKRWGVSSIESVYGRLSSMSKIAPSPNGIINIEIEDSDPVWAARLANGYADALQYITQGLAVNEASKRRVFYEQQMNVSLQQLTVAEMSLRKIQQETGVLNLDPQIQMAIQESNRLRTAIASKETELASMEAFATERNADYLRLQHEIDALKNQLEQWRRPVKASDDVALQASEGLLPEISMEYVKHVREVKNLELVYELFLKELQLTRIDQVKDATTVELLDKAIPPSTPSYPKKKRTIAIASLIGFLIAMVSILIYELTVVALKNEVNMSRVRMIREALRWSPPSVRFPRKLKFNVKFKRKNKE